MTEVNQENNRPKGNTEGSHERRVTEKRSDGGSRAAAKEQWFSQDDGETKSTSLSSQPVSLQLVGGEVYPFTKIQGFLVPQ